MAQPHKGERVPILVRVPSAVFDRIPQFDVSTPPSRNDWIVAAIEAQLRKEARHDHKAQIAAG